MAQHAELRGVEAYSQACHTTPLLERQNTSRAGVGLYGWSMPSTREVRIQQTRELTLSVHLGGSRRVHVFTENGLSRRFSRPGDITLIPSGTGIHYRTEGAVRFATVHFPVMWGAAAFDQAAATILNLSDCLFALRDDYVVSSVQTLMRASSSSSRDDQPYLNSLFESLTWHLARIIEDRKAERVRLAGKMSPAATPRVGADFDAVTALIDAHLGDKLTLEDLADCAGVGRTTFAEQFARQFGCTPHRYILLRRIERAVTLLQQGDSSVTEIAYELGFSSQSHFSTVFKALTGHAPSGIRNA